MKSAQSLVLSLPRHAVGTGFRDSVWERIHAGEGSPTIVLEAPTSTASKIRYGFLGAAAAAVFLVSLNLLTSDPTSTAVIETLASDEVERMPLSAAVLADHTLGEVSAAAQGLRRRETTRSTPDVSRNLAVIGGGLGLLHDLQLADFLLLGGQSSECMGDAMQMAQQLTREGGSPEQINELVEFLEDCPVERLTFTFNSTSRGIQRNPEIMQFMEARVPGLRGLFQNMRNPLMFPGGPTGQMVIIRLRSASQPEQKR
jgi:hypothetical protein